MICKIADLLVELSAADGMSLRCRDYLEDDAASADIVIDEKDYDLDFFSPLSRKDAVYLNSGWLFYTNLLRFGGLMLHASAIELDGKAYLFSGPSGMGKSTHTRLWRQAFGDRACIFNDDKPAIRRLNGKWYAYGTPWCGKDGINENKKVPLAGICFLQRGEKNKIRRLSQFEAIGGIISQTPNRFGTERGLDTMLGIAEQLAFDVPSFLLICTPELEAAYLSYDTMKNAVKEDILYEN